MKKKKTVIDVNTSFTSKEQAAKLGYTAMSIERISDGEILSLNSDLNTYSFSTKLVEGQKRYEYTYERLMDDHRAKGKFRVVSWVKNITPDILKLVNK